MIKRLHSTLFFVGDLGRTAEFYEKLGFAVQKFDDVVRIKIGDFTLAFMDEKKVEIDKESGVNPKGIGTFTYVEVDDVDQHFQLVKDAGVKTSSEPKDWPWGKREFAVKDPDGYKIVFYSPVKK
ncbi:MAG: hypothetical protein A3A29_00405 [Candidatus Ryanbacteria bacterium RIFCSPLOWO2_01_FULL_47_79]|uniref:VOC domain-containing protein n=1 Tax=Candidatus Yanofskybacteria bacterium RIFCSPHIGHO2_12_FULL_45_19b TaxID=1802689 RepID=A0A1F8G2W9_9BACT|nr:MAG: hypothetical protein A3F25_02125 [Candidatus Yanofskybacteria bacterium RIFCSPHIGHO2_12_FULL_45_19b]OGZ53297.1 MAG: hypothetical protein A3A29_00405 [Candidatus Ryanbacteria bacterium RIFCSPLOWO2_01_FULL_47_79]